MRHKNWSKPYLDAHPEVVCPVADFASAKTLSFLRHDRVYLEIGTGKGDFIVGMATKSPDAYFVGIEISTTALGFCARKVVDAGLKNVLLLNADASILGGICPNELFSAIFLNFSDPWPKKKHAKRRLTYDTMLTAYYRILKPNGLIYQKTDNTDLFRFSHENLLTFRYEILEHTDDYDGLAEFDAQTEYETNFRAKGVKIHRLIAQKGKDTYATLPQPKETVQDAD